jgi:hypothetical protein
MLFCIGFWFKRAVQRYLYGFFFLCHSKVFNIRCKSEEIKTFSTYEQKKVVLGFQHSPYSGKKIPLTAIMVLRLILVSFSNSIYGSGTSVCIDFINPSARLMPPSSNNKSTLLRELNESLSTSKKFSFFLNVTRQSMPFVFTRIQNEFQS